VSGDVEVKEGGISIGKENERSGKDREVIGGGKEESILKAEIHSIKRSGKKSIWGKQRGDTKGG